MKLLNNKFFLYAIGFLLVVLFALVFVRLTSATSYPKTICHHNPSHTVTLTFQNQQSYFGHLGTPHSGSTYDTNGACTQPSPTPTVTPTTTPVPTVVPSITPTPTSVPEEPEYCDDKEAINYEEEGECEYPEVTPTVTPTPTATPSPTPSSKPEEPQNSSSSVSTPTCTDGSTSKLVANLHVVRNGSQATVNFFITEGDSANIYYKVNESGNWQHSIIGVKPSSDNFVSYTINDLDANLGYTFGVQQIKGCGTEEIATSVVVDPPAKGKIFHFSFWEW